MNNVRRKRIALICTQLENIKEMIEDVKLDEEMAFDNMPENLQCSMRGEESEEAIDALDDAVSSLEDVIDNISLL